MAAVAPAARRRLLVLVRLPPRGGARIGGRVDREPGLVPHRHGGHWVDHAGRRSPSSAAAAAAAGAWRGLAPAAAVAGSGQLALFEYQGLHPVLQLLVPAGRALLRQLLAEQVLVVPAGARGRGVQECAVGGRGGTGRHEGAASTASKHSTAQHVMAGAAALQRARRSAPPGQPIPTPQHMRT